MTNLNYDDQLYLPFEQGYVPERTLERDPSEEGLYGIDAEDDENEDDEAEEDDRHPDPGE